MIIKLDRSELNKSQLEFLEARDKFLLLSAGFGAGKTTAGGLKVLQLSTLNPGVPGLIVAQSYTALKATVIRAINKLLPRNRKLSIIDPTGERYITLDGKTPIFCRTAHNPSLMDGLDVGWIYADEIRHYSKEAYDIMIGRRRVQCPFPQAAFTSTPAMHWMAAEYDANLPDRRTIFASTLENAANLEAGYIDGLRASYSKPMQRAVIEGIFTVLDGAVYDQFDASSGSPWFIDYDFSKYSGNKTFLAIDPGYRRPAVLWVREYEPLKWVIFHQAMPENLSTVRLVEEINGWNQKNDIGIDEIWVDPAADTKSQATEIDVMRVLRQVKTRQRSRSMRYTRGIFSGIEFGVERTRVMLGNPDMGQTIRMYISRAVSDDERRRAHAYGNRGVVKSLSAYCYPEIKDGRPVLDVPLKDNLHDHAMDALRYLCVGLCLTTSLRNTVLEVRDRKAVGVVSK